MAVTMANGILKQKRFFTSFLRYIIQPPSKVEFKSNDFNKSSLFAKTLTIIAARSDQLIEINVSEKDNHPPLVKVKTGE